jgi:hypothetical protein
MIEAALWRRSAGRRPGEGETEEEKPEAQLLWLYLGPELVKSV